MTQYTPEEAVDFLAVLNYQHVNNGALAVANKLNAAISHQAAEIERLKAERDESDRRAGQAEREKQWLAEDKIARNEWLSKAKRQWGVDNNTSFDVVWAECLSLKAELAECRDTNERLFSYSSELAVALMDDDNDLANEAWRALPENIQDKLNELTKTIDQARKESE